MSKRVCLPPPNVSASTFDLRIRPLYPHSGTEMPVCVEIEANVLSQSKEYATTLIVLADVSGSMLDGTKLRNMREGIVRLGELAERFCTASVELILIEFNDAARLTLSVPKMPSVAELQRICERLSPNGGTNIGAALDMALDQAKDRSTVHIALFTDGDDTCGLINQLDTRMQLLRTAPRTWLHCVGICADFDSRWVAVFFSALSQQSSALLAGSSTRWRAPLVARPSRASRTWTSPGSWARSGV